MYLKNSVTNGSITQISGMGALETFRLNMMMSHSGGKTANSVKLKPTKTNEGSSDEPLPSQSQLF